MIALRVEAPFGSFRKSYARGFAESYPLPPPSTIYGMLLSLVGERMRARHAGARLAIGYLAPPGERPRLPKVATVLRKLSRFKYGVPGKQYKEHGGRAVENPILDYAEVLCGIEFVVWVDSANETTRPGLSDRLAEAIDTPERVTRTGIVCLGLSDDAVNDIARWPGGDTREICWLQPRDDGGVELPVWVDHVGAAGTCWQRFQLDERSSPGAAPPPSEAWLGIRIPEHAT